MRVATEHHGGRRATAAVGSYSVTLRGWCGSHEGFERKSPLYVLELYPYTLQPRPERRRGGTTWPMHASGNFQLNGGSTANLHRFNLAGD